MNLVQKVAVTLATLFVITSVSVTLSISQVIRQSYFSEQKRTVSQFVLKQAAQYLNANNLQNKERLDLFRSTVSTPDVANVTIYSTKGEILASDDPSVVGKKLSPEALGSLSPVFGGTITTNIDKPFNGELLKMNIPLIFDDMNIVGVVELSIQLESLNSEILRSQMFVLAIVATVISIAFTIVFFIVRKASLTLVDQDKQLRLDIQQEKEYSKSKNEFISIASHQLRTPATVVLWSLEELLPEIKNKLSKETEKAVVSAQIAAKTLVNIINNILIVANIKPDYFSYEEKNYSPDNLIQEILDKNKKFIEIKKQQIVFESGAKESLVNIRRDALFMVIEVIFKNAVEYSEPESKITITTALGNDMIQVNISDNGIGIPEKEREKVFEQFF